MIHIDGGIGDDFVTHSYLSFPCLKNAFLRGTSLL